MEQAKVNNGSLNAYEKVYCIQGLVIFVDFHFGLYWLRMIMMLMFAWNCLNLPAIGIPLVYTHASLKKNQCQNRVAEGLSSWLNCYKYMVNRS